MDSGEQGIIPTGASTPDVVGDVLSDGLLAWFFPQAAVRLRDAGAQRVAFAGMVDDGYSTREEAEAGRSHVSRDATAAGRKVGDDGLRLVLHMTNFLALCSPIVRFGHCCWDTSRMRVWSLDARSLVELPFSFLNCGD